MFHPVSGDAQRLTYDAGRKCASGRKQMPGARSEAGTASCTCLPVVTHFGGNLATRVVEVRCAGADHVLLIQQVADVHREVGALGDLVVESGVEQRTSTTRVARLPPK